MENPLLSTLRDLQLLDEEVLNQALETQRETGWPLDKVLLSKGVLTEHDLLRAMSHSLGMEYAETLNHAVVPPVFVERVPAQFARNYNLVGLAQTNGTMRGGHGVAVRHSTPWTTWPRCSARGRAGPRPAGRDHAIINKAYQGPPATSRSSSTASRTTT